MLTQMVRVGEETGTLDTYLEQAADFYEEELEYRIRAMTSLIEPVMTVAVGLVVGFIAVSSSRPCMASSEPSNEAPPDRFQPG